MASSLCASPLLLGATVLNQTRHRHRHLRAFIPRYFCTRIKRHDARFEPAIVALFGGSGGGDPAKDKKKFITREEEPDQFWQSAAEKEGRGPMSTILPYIVIFGFLTPFIILGLGFANGWIKVPVR